MLKLMGILKGKKEKGSVALISFIANFERWRIFGFFVCGLGYEDWGGFQCIQINLLLFISNPVPYIFEWLMVRITYASIFSWRTWRAPFVSSPLRWKQRSRPPFVLSPSPLIPTCGQSRHVLSLSLSLPHRSSCFSKNYNMRISIIFWI